MIIKAKKNYASHFNCVGIKEMRWMYENGRQRKMNSW